MSSKFNPGRTRYVPPPICHPPPPEPLPPLYPYPLYVQAEGTLRWPAGGGTWKQWTRHFRDIYIGTTGHGFKEAACGDEVLRCTIAITWTTRKLTASLTAYKAFIFQASTTWIAHDLPTGDWWQLDLHAGDAHIPPEASGELRIWV